MGRVAASYDEKALCPRVMPRVWWYTLPSQTRTRIRAATTMTPEAEGCLIGEIQDRLISNGQNRLMGTFMRAMQECLDEEQKERERRETLWTPLKVGHIYPDAPQDAFRFLPEAEASVALDGETQVLQPAPTPGEGE